jgi:hypothetical protein
MPGHPPYALLVLTLIFPSVVKEQRKLVQFPSLSVSVVKGNGNSSPRQLMAYQTVHDLVEVNGIEPMTSCLQSRRSPI